MVKLKVKGLKSFIDKSVGLIRAKEIIPVYFKTRFGIHTFGLNFPIDVLILDKHNKIVKIRENIFPNQVFFWPLIYNKVIELPTGEIKRFNLKIDSQIVLEHTK